MQSTPNFHDHVPDVVPMQATGFLQHATAFDTAIDVLNPYPTACHGLVVGFLFCGEILATWLPCWHMYLDIGQRQGQKAQVLQERTCGWERIGCGISQALVVTFAWCRWTQEQNHQHGIDQEQVFHGMPLFLAALAVFLCIRIRGAWDGSSVTSWQKRG